MTAETFLDSQCVLWTERDDDVPHENGQENQLPGNTWRDWLIDFLATAHAMGEGFDAKRPNCAAGWADILQDVLHEHRTSFSEVLVVAFGMQHDRRPRTLLRPFGNQAVSLKLVAQFLNDALRDVHYHTSPEEIEAALEIAESALRQNDALLRNLQSSAGKTQPLPPLTITMGTIVHARRCAATYAEAVQWVDKPDWRCFMDYLDALVLRRHPTHSFLGIPLLW